MLAFVNPRALLDRTLAYATLRFTLGLSILMHGLVGPPHLSAFTDATARLFVDTPLPAAAVRLFGVGLLFVETAVGLLVLLGLWTRLAVLLGALTMAARVCGTALRSDWDTLAIEMLYALIYAALIATREYNAYSLDARIAG
jgi:thiosulfate dehydrogenase (quinone) large subunit